MTARRIEIPEFCLVLLIGPSGSGKSSFAARHFKPTAVISSDRCRGMVSDDETDQAATADAFALVGFIAEKRLAARRLTVIDATNVRREDRAQFIALAKRYHALAVAFVFDTPERLCHERNAGRADRAFGTHVVRKQVQAMKRGLKGIGREGIRFVHRFGDPAQVDEVEIVRNPLWVDKCDMAGPFDIIGDVHGCADELETLLADLGYRIEATGKPGGRHYQVTPPEGRRAVFLGDLVDRGPRVPDVLRLVKSMVDAGTALCINGNHEAKLVKKLKGRDVKIAHGLAATLEQFEAQEVGFVEEMLPFLDGLISHYVLDAGRLVVAHAGLREEMQNRASGAVRAFAMYGETTGETDEFGLPVRFDWASEYRGKAKVVYGHTPVPTAEWVNGTICIDTGCVFGGRLTALRYPELELVSVPAARIYAEPIRPLVTTTKSESVLDRTMLDVADVLGRRTIAAGLGRTVTVREEEAAAALEVMSRFAIDPRWLIYLPPTMSPAETSNMEGYLERPEEALAYYRGQGIATVVCEEKHMGSRAVIVLCREPGVADRRFGVPAGRRGVIYTRTGRAFFPEAETEKAVLDRLAAAAERARLWEDFETDWMCLDAEILPWSVKAGALIEQHYAPVGAAARIGLAASLEVLEAARACGIEVGDLHAGITARMAGADAFTLAYNRYVWPVSGLDGLEVAPFHLLATEGRVHADKDHRWHMETAHRLAAADPIVKATDYRIVDLGDDDAVAGIVAWWEGLTDAGGEGMVVKPLDFAARGKRGLVQPAVKCRGREYLRIIYGPDYDLPRHLDRLRVRGLGRKRSLALREFALGIEALERFVRHEPLSRVHECAFAVLALESDPVDPRL